MSKYETRGELVTADIWLRTDTSWERIKDVVIDAIAASKMTTVKDVGHKFDPEGETHVWILAESHLSVHTYPERKYISVDCYTCGDEGDPDAAIAHIVKMLNIEMCQISRMKRGVRGYV